MSVNNGCGIFLTVVCLFMLGCGGGETPADAGSMLDALQGSWTIDYERSREAVPGLTPAIAEGARMVFKERSMTSYNNEVRGGVVDFTVEENSPQRLVARSVASSDRVMTFSRRQDGAVDYDSGDGTTIVLRRVSP